MKPDKYTKLLLDSSFKESANMWARNTAFLTAESIIIGFFANYIVSKPAGSFPRIILSISGIAVSFLAIIISNVSKYYNSVWFEALESWVDLQSFADEENKSWSHLGNTLKYHERNLPWPGWHGSVILSYLYKFLLLAWILAFLLLLYHGFVIGNWHR